MMHPVPGEGDRSRFSALAVLPLAVVVMAFLLMVAVPRGEGQDAPPPPEPTLVPPTGPSLPIGEAPRPKQLNLLPDFATLESQQGLGPTRVLETLCVPADGSSVQTTMRLTQGVGYTIRVTGMYVWGGCDAFNCPGGGPDYLRWGDGEYLTDDHWHGFAVPYWSGFIHLKVNGSDLNLGSYNDGHVYTIQIPGNGQPARFSLDDCSYCYPDNSGCLRIEVVEGDVGGAFDLGVPPFQQCGLPATSQSRWGAEPYGDPSATDPGADTVCRWGCNLSSWAMILDYWGLRYGVHTNPRELNNWLRANDGYNGWDVNPWKVAEYGRALTSAALVFPGRKPWDPQRLHDLLQSGHPVMLKVGDHFVTATGETSFDGDRTWYINDPGGPGANLYTFPLSTLRARYGNEASRMEWGAVIEGPAILSSLSLALASPAEILVTDPAGRRTGLDPRTGIAYDEIPDAYYGTQGLVDDSGQAASSLKVFDLPAPDEGNYIIQVIGTGSGPYTLDLLTYDELGQPASATASGEIQPGMVHVYHVGYSSTPGSGIELVRITAVVIEKETRPSGGTGFAFSYDLDGSGAFSLDDGQNHTFFDVEPGQYSVTEHAPLVTPGSYDLINLVCVDSDGEGTASSGDKDTRMATIYLDPEETVVCTFTNTERGKIIVEKETVPGGDPTSFVFSGAIKASLGDGEREGRTVGRGTHTVRETVPPGWTLISISCSDADSSGDLGTGTATFQVKAGEKVLCIFTSSRQGTITVEKQTDPAGSDQAFAFSGAVQAQLKDNGTASEQVAPGSHSAWETVPAGWHLTSIQCNDDNSLSDVGLGVATFKVEPGEDVTCTFTNTQDAPDYELYLPLVLRHPE